MAGKRSLGRKNEEASKKLPLRTNHLLVIGIDKYKNGIRPLNNAVRDAKAFRNLLVSQYKFDPANVIELYDEQATEEKILEAFDEMLDKLTENDNLVLYFSGHGELHDRTNRGYWIPVNAVLNKRGTYFSNNEVIDFFKSLKAHHIFGIIDSCFSGALFADRKLGNQTERIDSLPSRWLLTAGRKEPVSDGSLGDNSPFASSLLANLKVKHQSGLWISDLCNSVLRGVSYNADKQTPRGEPLQNVNHQGGQFVFYPKNYVPSEQPAEPVVAPPSTRETHSPHEKATTPQKNSTGANSLTDFQFQLKMLIAEDIEKVFDRLRNSLNPSSKKNNDLIMQQGRYNGIKKQQMMGLVTDSQATLTHNQVRNALLYIIDDIDSDDLIDELKTKFS